MKRITYTKLCKQHDEGTLSIRAWSKDTNHALVDLYDREGRANREEVEVIMPVAVSTEEYEFSHGRKPKGYGLWWFATDRTPEFSYTGNYGEAKRHAISVAKEYGAEFVNVLP